MCHGTIFTANVSQQNVSRKMLIWKSWVLPDRFKNWKFVRLDKIPDCCLIGLARLMPDCFCSDRMGYALCRIGTCFMPGARCAFGSYGSRLGSSVSQGHGLIRSSSMRGAKVRYVFAEIPFTGALWALSILVSIWPCLICSGTWIAPVLRAILDMNKIAWNGPKLGREVRCPANPDLADILGDTDFAFVHFSFWGLFRFQIPRCTIDSR